MPHVASRIRLVDVAARAGVSATLVSAVLRNASGGTVRVARAKADRIRRVAAELGYRPNIAAQQLRGRASDVIGVLIGAESTAANFERLAAVEQEAFRRGYRLMVGLFRGESQRTARYLQDLVGRGIEAILCFHNPLPRHDRGVLELLGQVRGLVFQTEPLVAGAMCVDVDRAAGVAMAAEHLHSRGCQCIALAINSPPQTDPLMADRVRGFAASTEPGGTSRDGSPRQPSDSLIWAGDGTFPPPRCLVDRAVAQLVDQGRADAIIASNDVWAIEIVKAIRRAGRQVPEDVAVVGFDNLPAAALFDPALTSIDQNNEAFAAAAMDLLAASMEDTPLAQRHRVVMPRLVVRESA